MAEAFQLETPTLSTTRRSHFSLKLTYTAIKSLYQQKTDEDDELPIEIFAEEMNGPASIAANAQSARDDKKFYDFSEVIVMQIPLHEQS